MVGKTPARLQEDPICVAIDVPIGHLDGPRGCDVALRELLGQPRGCGVSRSPLLSSACKKAWLDERGFLKWGADLRDRFSPAQIKIRRGLTAALPAGRSL